jgi:hypothetical protein
MAVAKRGREAAAEALRRRNAAASASGSSSSTVTISAVAPDTVDVTETFETLAALRTLRTLRDSVAPFPAHQGGGMGATSSSARPSHVEERPCRLAATTNFPGAVRNSKLVASAMNIVRGRQYDLSKVLVATSLCSDEINKHLRSYIDKNVSESFTMGGLAGFPFTGKTGFGAFMRHVPDDGAMVIVCASHVGIDCIGDIGKVHRNGMNANLNSTACAACIAAYGFCESHRDLVDRVAVGDPAVYPAFAPDHADFTLDSQMCFIQKFVASRFKDISTASDPLVALAAATSEEIRQFVESIIPAQLEFPLYILSGIQINFEGEFEDYFQPITFTVRPPASEKVDLMPNLTCLLDLADVAEAKPARLSRRPPKKHPRKKPLPEAGSERKIKRPRGQ